MKTIIISKLKKAFILTALCFAVRSAYTQTPDQSVSKKRESNANVSEQVAVITRFEVNAKYRESFCKALANYSAGAVLKKGNLMAEAFHEQDKPTVLWLIERWTKNESKTFFKASKESMAIEALYPIAFVQERKVFLIKDLEPLTKEEWRRIPKNEDKPLTIMLFVDSKKGTEEDFKSVYHTAMPQFRSEPGVINYQLSQLEDDKTQFVTYEKFRNEDAFQYHLNFPPIKPVIDYLNTSIKEQPFQKGLHRLMQIPAAKQ